jgi:hypothetical protein
MRNRIKQYYKGGNMESENKFGVADLEKVLEQADGYMIAVSVLKDEKVTPFFMTHNYPKLDILKQLKQLREKAIEQLESEV